jgi:outer membrane protein
MEINRFFTLIVLMVMCCQNFFGQSTKWDLRECIDHAISNNITLKQNALNVESAIIVARQTKLNYIPDIGIQTGYQLSMGRSLDPTTYSFVENKFINSSNMSANIGTTIWNGFKRYNSRKKALSDFKISELELSVLKNNIALNITGLFYNILLNKEVIKSIENQLEISIANINKVKRLVEEGAVADEQLQNLLMQQQNEIYSLSESKGVLAKAVIDLCSLLELKNYDNFDVTEGEDKIEIATNQTLDDIINSAMTLPQIEAVNQKVISAQYAIKTAKADLYPTLSFNYSYSSSYSSARQQPRLDSQGSPVIENGAIAYKSYPFINQFNDNRTGVFGLNLSIPILNSFYRRNKVRLSRINLKQLSYEVENSKKQIIEDVQKMYLDVQISKEKYISSLAAVEHGMKIIAYQENKFNHGITTISDYIVAKNNILISEAQASKAKYEFLFKLKILKFYYTHTIN